MSESKGIDQLSRRMFLNGAWSWLRWLAGGLLLYPVFSFLGYRVSRPPRLVKVSRPTPTRGFVLEHEFILFVEAGKAWAVSRKCTHLGCRLNYQEKEGILLCPCHQSRFSQKGLRLAGPARKNLPLFPVQIMREGGEEKGYIVSL